MVTAEQRVFILHSQECRDTYPDLRECPYSLALDRGIELTAWRGLEDRPFVVGISVLSQRLVPVSEVDQ